MHPSIGHYRQGWSVSVTQDVGACVSEIWELLSKPGHLELFHPFCASNQARMWKGIGSVDQLVYHNGLTFLREFLRWEEERGFSLIIGEKNGKKSYVEWTLREKGAKSIVRIEVFPHFMREQPRLISAIPFLFSVYRPLKSYLRSVLAGLKWYVENGERVTPNQFGSHSWFS